MPHFDDVALKRTEAQNLKQQEAQRQQSIDAVMNSGREVVDSTEKLARSQDISSLQAEIQRLPEAMQSKKMVMLLADQTKLGEKLDTLGETFASTISQLNSSDIDNKQLAALTKVSAAIETFYTQLASESKANVQANTDVLKDVLEALKSLEVSPVINVPEPKVTVAAPKVTVSAPTVDLKPLQTTLQQYLSADDQEEKVDLECYKAQDLDESVSGFQYVGFVNPEGGWYIIENDVKGNRLRYIFGKSGYSKAFKKASTYQYSLLNEAIDALSA